MSLKIIKSYKNIGEILEENIKHDYNSIIFLDWDDTVISTSSLKNLNIEFRNQREKYEIIKSFKKLYESDLCLGLYILTYRQNLTDVQGESTELGILEYLKSDYKHRRTETYNRIGPLISVDYSSNKVTVLYDIINEDFNNLTDNVNIYFVDDNYQNIVSSLLTNTTNNNLFIYFFPNSKNDITIFDNIGKKANEILRYLK